MTSSSALHRVPYDGVTERLRLRNHEVVLAQGTHSAIRRIGEYHYRMAWRIPFLHRKLSREHREDMREASRDVHARVDSLREEALRSRERTDEQATDAQPPSSNEPAP